MRRERWPTIDPVKTVAWATTAAEREANPTLIGTMPTHTVMPRLSHSFALTVIRWTSVAEVPGSSTSQSHASSAWLASTCERVLTAADPWCDRGPVTAFDCSTDEQHGTRRLRLAHRSPMRVS